MKILQMSASAVVLTLSLVVLGTTGGTAVGQVYEESSSFEEFNDAIDFMMGMAPRRAHFTGAIAGSVGNFRFYHTGLKSWMAMEGQVGLLEFETPATQVEFYLLDSGPEVGGLLEVFDPAGGLLDSVFLTTTWQFYSFFGAIDHLTLTNQNGGFGSMSVIDDIGFNIEGCLSLSVENLVAGERARFTVGQGITGHATIVIYGVLSGSGVFADFNGWCADFGFDVPPSKALGRIVVQGVFDAGGEFSNQKRLPANVSGLQVTFQAVERETCPEVCMSNLVTMTIE